MKLGVDIFSLRLNPWTVYQHIDYAHRLGLQVVHFSDMQPFESLDERYLAGVKAYAAERQIEIEVGMGSICPTSTTFKPEQGPAEEQVRRMLTVAAQLGSPALRCYLGSGADRRTDLPLEAHMEATVKVCRHVRSQATDLNVKLAIENHAGDLQGHELKSLIEAAGPDFVGACIDSGNPLWTVEDPMVTLDHLAPYVLMSHVRDTVVAPHPLGAIAQWVPLGDGNVGMAAWIERFHQRCPETNLMLEIITSIPPRILAYLEPEFWQAYPHTSAAEFARFLALVAKGAPYTGPLLTTDAGAMSSDLQAALAQDQQRQLEKSMAYYRQLEIAAT